LKNNFYPVLARMTSNKAVTMARLALNGTMTTVQIKFPPAMLAHVNAHPSRGEYIRSLVAADMERQNWKECGEYLRRLQLSQTGARPDNAET
jgi:hypothetical protein